LTFPVPETGEYQVRVSDVRRFGGEDFTYELTARVPDPGFSVSLNKPELKISPQSGHEMMVSAVRHDGFGGPIEVSVEGLPEGLTSTSPVTIEANHLRALIGFHASDSLTTLEPEALEAIQIVARATVDGEMVEFNLPQLKKVEVREAPKFQVEVMPNGSNGNPTTGPDGMLELTIAPGATLKARVVAKRNGHTGRIDFGKEDAGRNLPHGIYVDNIGLNGLMIPEGKNEQEFFLTAAPWVEEMDRLFHLRGTQDDGQATQPVRLKVRKPSALADAK
ncbi:MAG: hypothetical protein AAF357_19370, partial [Verrucomicrobiota bacterium]